MPSGTMLPFSVSLSDMARISGTGITIYGGIYQGALGTLQFELNGFTGFIQLNSTSFSNGVSHVYRSESIQDGDHQLLGRVSLSSGGFTMDYLE